uniref:Inositol polyphosphate 5-phosphatase n=1 Tax=Aceria tosichella TaxID=561515 RepID=A0A6G1SD53_9ACAR
MDKKLNTVGQQVQQQHSQTPPPTPSEPDLISHQLAPSCDSPRRLNAPIDIDTALRLQSQASYVQEPARGGGSSGGGASAASLAGTASLAGPRSLACGQRYQERATPTVPTNANSSGGGDSNTLVSSNNQKQPQRRSNISLNNYYDHYNLRAQFPNASVNNISVDYIDCLSNNDLVASAAQGSVQATAAAGRDTAAAMRGIPSCRKHLSRFHRSHRIEPGQAAAGSQQQQQQQTTPSSSGDDDLPQSNNLQSGQIIQNNNNNNNDSSSLITSNSTNADDCSSSAAFEQFNQQQLDQSGSNTNNNPSGSILYPISVSEAKKRTYFIGSVSQISLLSHDELHRYFPNGRVSIFVCTWNQNRKRAPMNLNDLLLPDQLVYMPDIYAVGIQEAYSSQQDYLREWEIELQTTLGPNHVLLHSCSLGSLHLALFIRRDLIWFCSTPEESLYNSRSMPTNMIKTKGAISIAFRFFGTSFMFTNCHFPAHENKVRDRIDEYQRIINSIDLPKNLKLLKPRYLSNDSTARFDCVFFMGDLNFRLLNRTFDETIQILEDIFQSKEPSYEALTQNDELLKVMESQQAFHGFEESPIKFPPTYKFLAQTNKYDRQTKRVPSYTDRILFRSKRQRHIQCLIYDWLPQLLSSDHKPVYSLFDVLIRPGHERNMVGSLNAGLFQRTVYMEALKRRAEDSDGLRENGASGNLICSIS